MDNIAVCKVCGKEYGTETERHDFTCLSCKIEAMPQMLLEDAEAWDKEMDRRNKAFKVELDGFELDLDGDMI